MNTGHGKISASWLVVRPVNAKTVGGITSVSGEIAVQVCFNIVLLLSLLTYYSGRWMASEVEKLKEMADIERDAKGRINWSKVSKGMGGIRSRQQCQEKWYTFRYLIHNDFLTWIQEPTVSYREGSKDSSLG